MGLTLQQQQSFVPLREQAHRAGDEPLVAVLLLVAPHRRKELVGHLRSEGLLHGCQKAFPGSFSVTSGKTSQNACLQPTQSIIQSGKWLQENLMINLCNGSCSSEAGPAAVTLEEEVCTNCNLPVWPGLCKCPLETCTPRCCPPPLSC